MFQSSRENFSFRPNRSRSPSAPRKGHRPKCGEDGASPLDPGCAMVCHPFRGEPWRAVAIGPPVTDYIALLDLAARRICGVLQQAKKFCSSATVSFENQLPREPSFEALAKLLRYLTSRVAVKLPTVERNPLKFSSSMVHPTKIALPDMELVESNLPLNISVPISRQQVPSWNSTSPEKLIRLFVVSDHTAGRGAATDLLAGPASRS